VQQHDDEIVDVKELLRLEPTLFPRFEVRCLERVEDLWKTAGDPALLEATFSSDIAQPVSRDPARGAPVACYR
jgi:hypothetical protein